MAYNTDPRLLDAIRQAPPEFQAELLATTWVESGGRLNAVGDGGRSHGPYQEYDLGRGHGIPIAQRRDPVASTQRAAREFQQYYNRGLRGGQLAVSAQRPANRSAYVSKINSLLDDARRALGGTAPTTRRGSPGEVATYGQQPELPASPSRPDIGATLANAVATRRRGQSLSSVIAAALAAAPITPQGATNAAGRRVTTPTAGAPQGDDGHSRGDGSKPFGSGAKTQLIGGPGQGTHTLGNWQSDNAIDLRVQEGTPIYALADGVIGSRIGSLGKGGRFAGQRLTLESANNAFYYAHLKSLAVQAGQRVRKGQLLGYSGSANGVPHLHLGTRRGDPRQYA